MSPECLNFHLPAAATCQTLFQICVPVLKDTVYFSDNRGTECKTLNKDCRSRRNVGLGIFGHPRLWTVEALEWIAVCFCLHLSVFEGITKEDASSQDWGTRRRSFFWEFFNIVKKMLWNSTSESHWENYSTKSKRETCVFKYGISLYLSYIWSMTNSCTVFLHLSAVRGMDLQLSIETMCLLLNTSPPLQINQP